MIGGMAGKGGPGDIFKVGKSPAKKFSKVSSKTNFLAYLFEEPA